MRPYGLGVGVNVTLDMLSILRAVGPAIWSAKIKLVRHRDTRYDLRQLLRSGHLWAYEASQGSAKFRGAEYILSFLGEGGSRSRFIGCRRVLGVGKCRVAFPSGFPYPELRDAPFWYALEPVSGFEALEDRLVVDWGEGTRAWVQWLKPEAPKRVIELLPEGHEGDFPGYGDVLLPFSSLVRIVGHPEANRSWHVALSQVAGIYLIADATSGQLYVGSAHGQGGILSRWSAYVRSGHGGNKRLIDALAEDGSRREHWQFSILRTLPLSMTAREVHAVEALYKRKLGSRAFGLNAN